MKRVITVLVFLCMHAGGIFPTTFEECALLGAYYGRGPSVLHQMIAGYEEKLKNDSNDNLANLAIGILYFGLASPSDNHEDGAAAKVVNYTDRFLSKEKDDPLGLIYNGVSHGFLARDSGFFITKMIEANKGINICDKAVALAKGKTGEWNIRFMRANFYINLPEFFNKRNIAVSDFRFVEDEYDKNTNNLSMEGPMCIVYYYLGEIEKSDKNIDRAIVYWKKSVQLNDRLSMNSHEAGKSKKELETFSD